MSHGLTTLVSLIWKSQTSSQSTRSTCIESAMLSSNDFKPLPIERLFSRCGSHPRIACVVLASGSHDDGAINRTTEDLGIEQGACDSHMYKSTARRPVLVR
ncbi:hypothetical protein ACJQWK_03896 [Exserohilum turcicum]